MNGIMGAQISAEEKSILTVFMSILKKQSVKFQEPALRLLLVWCKENGLPAEREMCSLLHLSQLSAQ